LSLVHDSEILANLRASVIVLDAGGTIIRATGATQGVLGYGVDEMVGRHATEFIPDEHVEEMAFVFSGAAGEIRRQFPTPFPLPLLAKDGTVESVECLVTGVDGAVGQRWIVTLTPRSLQSVSYVALDRYIEGANGLDVAKSVAQRLSTTSPEGLRMEAIVLHDYINGRFTSAVAVENNSPIGAAVVSQVADLAAPWHDPGSARCLPIAIDDLPEPMKSAAIADGLVLGQVGVVRAETVPQLAILMFVNDPYGFRGNTRFVVDPALEVVEVALSRSRLELTLQGEARRDALTGMANRRGFGRVLDELEASDVAVLYIDIDDFKAINDTFGHVAGDAVLVEVARRIAATCRPSDVVARFGGDEFAVLLRNVDESVAQRVGGRIAVAIAAPMPTNIGPMAVSASVGVASSADGEHLSDLLYSADQAMLTGKRHGHGRLTAAATDS
jgi:diguanylate cyclase (GGDEF)-like protein/PAS domain S-box-containing protein